jgi:hypothetical protein
MWTDDKLFQPRGSEPTQKTVPYPQLDGYMSAEEMAQVLSALVFTKAKDWRRPIHLTPKARDKLVKALLGSLPSSPSRFLKDDGGILRGGS